MPAILLLVASSSFSFFAAEEAAVGAWINAAAVSLTAGVTAPLSVALRRRRGRPRKFGAPARAVTVTLPETVIASLSERHADLSRAIVAMVTEGTPTNAKAPAELAVFGRRAVITIRPTASLERRTGIDLVPLPDGRALISFDQPKTIADFELLLGDALDDPKLQGHDRNVFEGIRHILKEARRSKDVFLLRRSIIVLELSDTAPRFRSPRGSKT